MVSLIYCLQKDNWNQVLYKKQQIAIGITLKTVVVVHYEWYGSLLRVAWIKECHKLWVNPVFLLITLDQHLNTVQESVSLLWVVFPDYTQKISLYANLLVECLKL